MMEMVLFAVSGINVVYYLILVIFTDAAWMTQTYWPISAAIFLVIGLILRVDRKRKLEHKKCIPLEVRTFICSSCILYFILLVIGTVLILFYAFPKNVENADYLILIENGDVEEELTENDYRALNCTVEYMNQDQTVKVILAGCNRFRDLVVDEMELQDLMKNYLQEQGIDSNRIITETISNNLRQNIIYSYAYILVDWYGEDSRRSEDPTIGVIAEPVSIFRYRMLLDNMGSFSGKIGIVSFQEPILVWPARIIEEMGLLVEYHLINQFAYVK